MHSITMPDFPLNEVIFPLIINKPIFTVRSQTRENHFCIRFINKLFSRLFLGRPLIRVEDDSSILNKKNVRIEFLSILIKLFFTYRSLWEKLAS